MTQLDRRQFTQQFAAAELDQVSLVRGERAPVGQPGVNGVAGVDEIRGLFTNINHGGTPYEEEDEECGERICSLTGHQGKRYRTCLVGIFC